MQAYGYLLVGPASTSFDGGVSSAGSTWIGMYWSSRRGHGGRRRFLASAASATNGRRSSNHYTVLGVSPNASSSDIKKAYRLLALKYHPDINKELGASETFKSIRLAYDILIDETTRSQYDQALQYPESIGRPLADDWVFSSKVGDELRFNKWAYIRRKMRDDKYFWEQYYNNGEEKFSHDDIGKVFEEETLDEEREPFIEVLKSAFLSLFLMQTLGIRLSLTFSSLMALIDPKLDAGYKFGYLFAWILGGRGGILLTMFLSFASWVCGKTSSSIVALVVIAMWFGSNLARYAPLPQGALLTLLYMSIKLQVDLK